MNGDIERLTRERDKERKHVARIMRDLDHNRTRAEKAEVAISERDRRIAELEAKNEYLGDEIDNLEADGCNYDDTIRKLEAELTASRAECEGLRAALEDMLFEYGDKYDDECRLKGAGELEIIAKARAALSQKENGDAA